MIWDLIVVGGGISGLAAAYEAKKRGRRVLVLERSGHCGGAVRTQHRDGCLLEEGAESLLSIKPAARQLCEELGMAEDLIGTQSQYGGALVVKGPQLYPVPEGFRLLAPQEVLPFLRSPVFSWWGKVRMGLEWFIPPRRDTSDESLAQFVRRRFGRECLDRMAQPLAAGIYTADPEDLSMQAAMPQFVELERRYGSILRGFFRNRGTRGTAAGPRYTLFQTLRHGLGQIPAKIVEFLGPDAVRLDSPVQALTPRQGEWEVALADETLTARQVVLAVPAHAAVPLCRGCAPLLAQELAAVPYLSSATVNLVYLLSAIEHNTKAYGFVAPAVEHRDILACTFSHRKYADRCPPDAALLRTYLGGAHDQKMMDYSDEQMIERSHNELRCFLGIQGPPVFAHIARAPLSMPVYQVGHLDRVARIEQAAQQVPGLITVGNYLYGVGVPDCIALARRRIQEVLATDPTH